MHSFESDYTAGARVEILRRLNETNLEQLPGYGSDKYCESAKEKMEKAIADAEQAAREYLEACRAARAGTEA